MTREEMRVRVAKIFCADQNGPWPECVCSTKEALDCPECLMHADAAIAIIRGETLEEAAGAVKECLFTKSCCCSFEAEAAIRALKD